MGSAASAQKQDKPASPHEPKESQMIQELKIEEVPKHIHQMIKKESQALKSSQSVNLERTKNQNKIKKVKDIRSMQSLKDINLKNNENQHHLPQVYHQEIEDVSVCKKALRQLNPVTKKKLASDRSMISQHAKTESVISSHFDSMASLEGRTKKCRVSKML